MNFMGHKHSDSQTVAYWEEATRTVLLKYQSAQDLPEDVAKIQNSFSLSFEIFWRKLRKRREAGIFSLFVCGLLAKILEKGIREGGGDVESQEVASWVLFDLSSFPHGFLCQLFHDLCDCPVAPASRGVQTDLSLLHTSDHLES